jgi:AcrR family transcriptional regulator
MKKESKNELAKIGKGEQTKALIMETALEMLLERGYEQTTMRALAERAGVSLGNAYHYFRSKDDLIQAFYARTHDEHIAASARTLERERDLKTRLLEIMRAKIATAEPYHQFAGALFKTAADPRSHLNPFSEESRAVREESIALFAETLNGSDARVHKELRAELPYLLWLYHMGIILFWIHDESPKRRRTHRLIEITVDLLVKLIALASNPLMRPLRKATLRILSELREGIPDEPVKAIEG